MLTIALFTFNMINYQPKIHALLSFMLVISLCILYFSIHLYTLNIVLLPSFKSDYFAFGLSRAYKSH